MELRGAAMLAPRQIEGVIPFMRTIALDEELPVDDNIALLAVAKNAATKGNGSEDASLQMLRAAKLLQAKESVLERRGCESTVRGIEVKHALTKVEVAMANLRKSAATARKDKGKEQGKEPAKAKASMTPDKYCKKRGGWHNRGSTCARPFCLETRSWRKKWNGTQYFVWNLCMCWPKTRLRYRAWTLQQTAGIY